jgi:hypothetical protein
MYMSTAPFQFFNMVSITAMTTRMTKDSNAPTMTIVLESSLLVFSESWLTVMNYNRKFKHLQIAATIS